MTVQKMEQELSDLREAGRKIAALTAELARVKAELAKWQRPFDQERLDAVKQQASRQDSLAAMQVYITALEHGIKAIKAERDAAFKDAERYRWLRNATDWDLNVVDTLNAEVHVGNSLDAAIDAAIAAREG